MIDLVGYGSDFDPMKRIICSRMKTGAIRFLYQSFSFYLDDKHNGDIPRDLEVWNHEFMVSGLAWGTSFANDMSAILRGD